MSFGIRDNEFPARAPTDSTTAKHLREWLGTSREKVFNGAGLDFRGADLSGGIFDSAWLSEANFAGVSLAGAELYYGQLQRVNFEGANLGSANLFKAELDYSNLKKAHFSGANLRKASLYDVDAREADFVAAELFDAVLIKVDLRGADLTNANVDQSVFDVWLDESTQVNGLHGSIVGPAYISDAVGNRQLDCGDLAQWLNSRGAEIVVSLSKTSELRSSSFA